jgi:photosystem II stability/assembly factor-like uncharacterized protein
VRASRHAYLTPTVPLFSSSFRQVSKKTSGTGPIKALAACALALGLGLPQAPNLEANTPPHPTSELDPPPSTAPSQEAAPNFLLTKGGVAWAAEDNAVLRSTNGGTSWERVFPTKPVSPVAEVIGPGFFLGPSQAWVLDVKTATNSTKSLGSVWANASVWASSDGGAHWRQSKPIPNYPSPVSVLVFDDLYFADPLQGILVAFGAHYSPSGGPARLYLAAWSTANGGSSWSEIPPKSLPDQGSPIAPGSPCGSWNSFGVEMTSAADIWLAPEACGGDEANLWQSTDGGLSWTTTKLPPPKGGWPPGGIFVMPPRFFGSENGETVATSAHGQAWFFSTSDGGKSWRLQASLDTGSLDRLESVSLLSPTSWVVPAPGGLFETKDAGRHWQRTSAGMSLDQVDEMSFESPSYGMLVSAISPVPAVALLTTNGGRSWRIVGANLVVARGSNEQAEGGPGSPGADFVDSSHGYLATSDGLLASRDGGLEWTRLRLPPTQIFQVDFVDDANGWVVGPDEVFNTTNAGRTWRPVEEPAEGPIATLRFFDPRHGVAAVCTQGGIALLATANGGESWKQLAVPLPVWLPAGCMLGGGSEAVSGTGGAACFASPSVGYALISTRSGASVPALIVTYDGGHRWVEVSGAAPGELVGCSGDVVWGLVNTGLAMNGESYALYVRSIRSPWQEVLAHPLPGVRPPRLTGAQLPKRTPDVALPGVAGPLDVVNANVAWFAGLCYACSSTRRTPESLVELLHTTNRGQSWELVPGPVERPLPYVLPPVSVDFVSSNTGYVVGTGKKLGEEVILETNDAGRDWRLLKVLSVG